MEFIYKQDNKERLDKYLQDKLDISRSQIKKAILAGQITVNGQESSVHRWLKKLIADGWKLHPEIGDFRMDTN